MSDFINFVLRQVGQQAVLVSSQLPGLFVAAASPESMTHELVASLRTYADLISDVGIEGNVELDTPVTPHVVRRELVNLANRLDAVRVFQPRFPDMKREVHWNPLQLLN